MLNVWLCARYRCSYYIIIKYEPSSWGCRGNPCALSKDLAYNFLSVTIELFRRLLPLHEALRMEMCRRRRFKKNSFADVVDKRRLQGLDAVVDRSRQLGGGAGNNLFSRLKSTNVCCWLLLLIWLLLSTLYPVQRPKLFSNESVKSGA